MMGMSGSHKDNGPFLDFLKIITNEHQNIKAFKQEFNDCYQRKDIGMMKKIANSTILTAALHSDSEEASVYKALDEHGFKEQADKDRADHQQVKQLMDKLEHTSLTEQNIDAYHKLYNEAVDLFIHHADDEENPSVIGSLAQLHTKVSQEKADELGQQFLTARKMAPERPHPEAPQSGGVAHKMAAAFTKPIDKLMHVGREYAKPKHDFPSIGV